MIQAWHWAVGQHGWRSLIRTICARVIEAIEERATREEAAERHDVSLSSVGRFLQLKRDTGSFSPAKFGGYKPYAQAAHEQLVRGLEHVPAGWNRRDSLGPLEERV